MYDLPPNGRVALLTTMGILQRIWTSNPLSARLLAGLAEMTGRNEELAHRLKRHAGLCSLPNIASGLAILAEREAEHAHALRAILSQRHVWSRLPRSPGAEGSNNWARVSGDLAMLLDLLNDMNQQVMKWEGIDAPFAARLRPIMLEYDRNVGELRDLALRCDPQALD
jgi:hypothetical protein